MHKEVEIAVMQVGSESQCLARLAPPGYRRLVKPLGNHTDRGTTGYGDRVMGAGFTAPMDEGRTIHHNGSQKRR